VAWWGQDEQGHKAGAGIYFANLIWNSGGKYITLATNKFIWD